MIINANKNSLQIIFCLKVNIFLMQEFFNLVKPSAQNY